MSHPDLHLDLDLYVAGTSFAVSRLLLHHSSLLSRNVCLWSLVASGFTLEFFFLFFRGKCLLALAVSKYNLYYSSLL